MKKIVGVFILCLVTCCVFAQSDLSDRDKKFAAEAAEGNLMEIKLGELAQSNGASEEVRRLGKKMVNDHQRANEELSTLAASRGITLPTGLSEKGQKAVDKFSKKNGHDFDVAYTKCMVKDHKKDICKFKKEGKKGGDAQVKTWASNNVATLEQHKQLAKDACKAIRS
jgi:putative membrane protein